MAGAYQGFEIKRNLEENTIDRNALNNLGTSPIADDIVLFKNNRRNISSLVVTNNNINSVSDTIFFDNRDIVFTSGTKVILNDTNVYYVKNSNAENEFQLSVNSNLSDTVELSNSFSGTYFRSDEVTFENITNYRKKRRAVLTGSTSDIFVAGFNSPSVFETQVNNNIIAIEDKLTNFKSIKIDSILTDVSFTTDINFNKEGHTLITDPDNINNLNLTANSGPGLFIYNYATNTVIRAFSDSQNVWKKNDANTYLETTAKKITIGTLTVQSNSIVLDQKSGSSSNLVIQASTPSNITTSVFRHKLKILVNGEEYFLCLSNTAAVP